MNFFIKYTRSNIRTNKMRAALLIFCIAFASILFFASVIFPIYLENYQESRLRSYFGNSDIYIQANADSNKAIDTLDLIPDELKDKFEYCYGFIAIPSTHKDKPITLVAGYFEEVQDFNPVKVVAGNTQNFSGKKIIITASAAKNFGWSVGETVLLNYPGLQLSQSDRAFTVAAIVANQGLLSDENETAGPIVFMAKDGVFSLIRKVGQKLGFDDAEAFSDAQLNQFFNTCVIKLKDGVDIQGIASELERIYSGYQVSETVNNETLKRMVSYINLPFIACIIVVCAFCVLIIYLTCKLTFSERVRQFATLKSMGATTSNLLFCLLLESAFYGLVGGLIGALLGLLQVYVIPLIAPSATYISPVSFWLYFATFFFGIIFAVASSFSQALKNARKSIKETMIKQEKFSVASQKLTYIFLAVFAVVALAMLVFVNIRTKWIAVVLFLSALTSLLFVLPVIMLWFFRVYKSVFRRKTFEHLYMEKTLPSKNLSVANRLLFFGLFLVFMFSTLLISLDKLNTNGQSRPYQISISQVSSSNISDETFLEIKNTTGVKDAWKSIFLENIWFGKANKDISKLFGYDLETIEKLFKSKIRNFDAVKKKMQGGNGIILNKYYNSALGFNVGETIKLVNKRSAEFQLEFKIVGFIDDYSNYGSYGVCLIDDLQAVPNTDGFNNIFISIENGAKAEDVISTLRSMPALGGTTEEEEGEGGEEETGELVFFTFINHLQKSEIIFKQMEVPFSIIRVYSIMVLVLCLLCIFIGYVLYLRESTEYHKALFTLGMSPNRFKNLVVRQSIFMSIATTICAFIMSMLMYLHLENIFNAIGTVFTTKINWVELGYFSLGAFVGTTIMAYLLGLHFKRELSRSNKRLFG